MHEEHSAEQGVGNQQRMAEGPKRNFLYTFSDVDETGDYYKGEFVLTNKHEFVRWGQGVMQYANGSVFEG